MSPAEQDATRAALREALDALVEGLPPLSPEDEAAAQRMMHRDRLLQALSAAHLANDEAALVTAKRALTEFDEMCCLKSRTSPPRPPPSVRPLRK